MTKTNYLFSGILAAAIVFAGCSSQPKYTAFGGGWGHEKSTTFQTKDAPKTLAQTKNNEINESEKTILVDATTNEKENTKSTLENATKSSNAKTSKKVAKLLIDEKINSTEKISIKKPSTWKASNLFSRKTKVNSGGGSDTAGWGIASFACSFVGLFFLGILFGILAIVFGAIGINKNLKGLAIAGLILGVIDVVAFFLLLAMFL